MAETQTLDPRSTNVIYNGVAVVGFAKNSSIKVEKKEDNFEASTGLMGDVTAIENCDETGTITLKIKRGSSSIPFFIKEAKKRGDAAWAPCQVIDLNANAVSSSGTKCRVVKAPSIELGGEVGEVEIQIFVADLQMN
ncbi:hypothetical protein LNN31_13590 [Acetobacterium wieringae]|uniref:DUF3277 family protein n=1 Tax=Acetobacterium wieringae TaxID=52694 RepID=A0ABY6HCZ2_9FIRM|nr:hypothetical protein [Acetobacterium wieringae]UYO61809.1 hypothetical protein LNN31_13590 [Acetobacterium wieringae]